MNRIDENVRRQVNQLVDAYRDRCLWFLRADYYPTDLPDVLRTLDYIRRYGDPQGRGVAPMAVSEFQRAICRLIAAIGQVQDATGAICGWKRTLAWPMR